MAASAPPSKLLQRVVKSPFRTDILKGQVALITGESQAARHGQQECVAGAG